MKELASPSRFLTCDGIATVELREHARTEELPSFEELYERHLGFVWRSLRTLGVAPAALEDAAQDVFVVVHRRLPSFERRARITTWLFAIAMRVARDHRQPQTSAEQVDDLEEALLDDAPGPFELTARSEAGRLLERLVDALDEEKRIPFVLVEIEQMTANEVAELLGIPMNTVYSRLRHARAEFNRLVAYRVRRPR